MQPHLNMRMGNAVTSVRLQVPASATCLPSAPPQVGWDNFFSNVLFWALVLAGKFAFDWFALMK